MSSQSSGSGNNSPSLLRTHIRYASDSQIPIRARHHGIMEEPEQEARPDLETFDSSGTGSSGDDPYNGTQRDSYSDSDGITRTHFSPSTSSVGYGGGGQDEVTPLTNVSTYGWTPTASTSRTSTRGTSSMPHATVPEYATLPPGSTVANGTLPGKQIRPGNTRQPSSVYRPDRGPGAMRGVFNSIDTRRTRNSSAHGRRRRNPNDEYRAQEKAYVQRIQQTGQENEFYGEPRTPSLGYSSGSESDEESPTNLTHVDHDPAEVDTLLYYGNEDLEPSMEELNIPANRERLEWHAMLANVLTGDVVKQEKKRLIGGPEQQSNVSSLA